MLAGMHYNYNANRPQAINKYGKPATKTSFPKFKAGEASVRVRKKDADFGRSTNNHNTLNTQL